jgi:sec-independent protein translocase protein TatC
MAMMRGFLALNDPDPKNMTVIEHLEELRSRLLVCVIAVSVAAVGSLFLYNWLISLLLVPLQPLASHLIGSSDSPVVHQVCQTTRAGARLCHNVITHHYQIKLIFTKPTDAIFLRLKLAVFPALVICVPVLLYELWMFIAPAFEVQTRRYAVPFVTLGLVLFLIGALIGYLIFPRYFSFLITIAGNNVSYLPDLNSLLNQFALIILIFGGVFELPIVLTMLSRVNIVSSSLLRRKRKVWFFIALFAGMIITPGADPFTPLIVGVLLMILYEFSIILIRMGHR